MISGSLHGQIHGRMQQRVHVAGAAGNRRAMPILDLRNEADLDRQYNVGSERLYEVSIRELLGKGLDGLGGASSLAYLAQAGPIGTRRPLMARICGKHDVLPLVVEESSRISHC